MKLLLLTKMVLAFFTLFCYEYVLYLINVVKIEIEYRS
jgi:hypothetical protein